MNSSEKSFSYNDGSEYGIQSSLHTNLRTVQKDVKIGHPLESTAKSFSSQMDTTMLRNNQGIHAPLRLQMEINAVNKAITRLPCLPSSNFALEILNGTDDIISPEHILGCEDSEVMGDPHLMMEHKLGLKPL